MLSDHNITHLNQWTVLEAEPGAGKFYSILNLDTNQLEIMSCFSKGGEKIYFTRKTRREERRHARNFRIRAFKFISPRTNRGFWFTREEFAAMFESGNYRIV